MSLYLWAVALAVASNLLYHFCQKLTPPGANPAAALVVTYLAALVVSLVVVGFLYPIKTGLGPALRQLNWASVALGAAIVGIELGFLLAYRSGGNISQAQIVVSAAVTLLLIPAGLIIFKEKLTWANILGMVLCLAGLVLINLKP